MKNKISVDKRAALLFRRSCLPEAARRVPTTERRSRRLRSLLRSAVGCIRMSSRRWMDQRPATAKPQLPQTTVNPRNRCSEAGRCRRHSQRWGLPPSPRWAPRDPYIEFSPGLGAHREGGSMGKSYFDPVLHRVNSETVSKTSRKKSSVQMQ